MLQKLDETRNFLKAGAQREVETLGVLRRELPDCYTVYRGVHWTQLNKGFSIFGEADFAVVSPSGRVLVIEQNARARRNARWPRESLWRSKEKRARPDRSNDIQSARPLYRCIRRAPLDVHRVESIGGRPLSRIVIDRVGSTSVCLQPP
ncbi:hypothetical protein [Paraburkholderia diazotrophica]|uniref:hypothetical protein n=1 Tax=Paraburkholderia diazotrophica TaxID=667676 RepID=UPI003D179563